MDSATIALIGALAIHFGGVDQKISDDLTKSYPISGSAEQARDYSDWGVNATNAAWLISGAIYDPVALPFQYVGDKARGALTVGWKRQSNRLRPDKSDRLSFPSGHSARASYRAHSAINNLDGRYPMIDAALLATAAATAFFRVESGRHYPTDVLVGYALGDYMAKAIDSGVSFAFSRKQKEMSLLYNWRF